MRTAEIKRMTAETDIEVLLALDEKGPAVINTGCGFFDHMLTLFAKHSGFSLKAICNGDTDVDYHHSVEDIGICLGQAFAKALGDRKGIMRYADTTLPMDESLVLTAVDISGRAYLSFNVPMPSAKVGDFDTELVKEFFEAFVRTAGVTLHVRLLAGENTHHVIEGVFKSFARTMRKACAIDPENADEIPSTKGLLD
ncbi:MAG: imidazoleglycerol-phosphate dehydratase HisB [Ruminococcaceae bacterium]|nr:imidazoleglycerol-phosphate dehydratase HisB [Oscillospiraceae bacterium]